MNPPQASSFELQAWGLHACSVAHQQFFHAAFRHDLNELKNHYQANNPWTHSLVNPAHVFACGVSRGGGLRQSREVLAWLLDHGGSLTELDASGWLPINYAAWFGLAGTIDVMLELNSPVHHPLNPQPLDSALAGMFHNHHGNETCAKLLLMHNADPMRGNSTDMLHGGMSWLMWALESQRWEWAECLYAKGARLKNDKELHLLIGRASAQALVWAQEHHIDVVKYMTSDHEHWPIMMAAQAYQERQQILEGVGIKEFHPQEEGDSDKDSGKKRM